MRVDIAGRWVWFGLAVISAALAGCSLPATEDTSAAEDPAVLDTTSVESPTEPTPSAEAPAESTPVSSEMTADIAFGDDALLEGLAPAGWTQLGGIEHYNVASLYDKIDGRSELYMGYDVKGLSWTTFGKDGDSSRFIDVFAYDMRSVTGAFGIYSVERELDQPKVEFGREGYRTRSNYYFWKGQYYVYVNSSHESDDATEAGRAIAAAIAGRLKDSGEPIIGIDWLPREGLVEDSIQFFKVDAMAMDFMTDTFTGLYTWTDDRIKVFITKKASDEEASNVLAKYHEYLNDYGDGVERFDVAGVSVSIANLGADFYDAVFQKGNTIAGVSAVKGGDLTRTSAEKLVGILQSP